MIIGLTGKRGVGKSTVADTLEEFGFTRVHAFDGGKSATFGYFRHLGMSEDMADRSVYGDLRDEPNEFLPGSATPRFFMEKFGKFMGTVMGGDWTLGAEIDRVRRQFPRSPMVVESVVYEAGLLKERGGLVVRVTRPGFVGVVGLETDAAEAGIVADAELSNDGTLEDLAIKVKRMLSEPWALRETES